MKKTAVAPSNIALIKYWGRKDEDLRLPTNGSISMNLSNLTTTTTVATDPSYAKDLVLIDGQEDSKKSDRVSRHLDRIRARAGSKHYAKVVSQNNFPSETGLSSSASGFAALTVAAVAAYGMTLSEQELSILARQGSGSACRSIPDGFVEWLDGDTSETSYANTIFPEDHWDICDVVSIVSTAKKDVSTSEGQQSATTSPFFSLRIQNIKEKIAKIKEFIETRKFEAFGELVESEALELHAIMLTSHPSLIYWQAGTLVVMKEVKKLRRAGLPVYFTLNTGQDIHLIVKRKNVDLLQKHLQAIEEVRSIIVNEPARGARLSGKHLF